MYAQLKRWRHRPQRDGDDLGEEDEVGADGPLDLVLLEGHKADVMRRDHTRFGFQLDLGTAFGERGDPIGFIKANPGRVRSYHLKDWSADRSRRGLLIGEGDVQWTELFKAAENTGGVEYYLIQAVEPKVGRGCLISRFQTWPLGAQPLH